ncbi:MAG: hypothetical protein FWB97_11085 [Oscillospiraceae bacterium]|nr:hypothetical protein [Oscillospiraceae bacterium]
MAGNDKRIFAFPALLGKQPLTYVGFLLFTQKNIAPPTGMLYRGNIRQLQEVGTASMQMVEIFNEEEKLW